MIEQTRQYKILIIVVILMFIFTFCGAIFFSIYRPANVESPSSTIVSLTSSSKASTQFDTEISEQERRKIYLEVSQSELRALREVDAIYPPGSQLLIDNVDEYLELIGSLEKKYREEILLKYSISRDQWFEIFGEGVRKQWALNE